MWSLAMIDSFFFQQIVHLKNELREKEFRCQIASGQLRLHGLLEFAVIKHHIIRLVVWFSRSESKDESFESFWSGFIMRHNDSPRMRQGCLVFYWQRIPTTKCPSIACVNLHARFDPHLATSTDPLPSPEMATTAVHSPLGEPSKINWSSRKCWHRHQIHYCLPKRQTTTYCWSGVFWNR